ncbi:RodZ domain-containing protein [Motilimonas sp. KMU-193]|uniref:RodZ domain-containing protein n=1 Tax=Motilimonas sp. KMU-193 TaxID=3388668 RepID=UPI00396B149F
MNTENNSPEEIQDLGPSGPGPMLRAEREKQGLTVTDIAARLNLRAHNINDIENETFDPKVSPTFIKGYLKAYARILGISEEEILNAYYSLGIKEPNNTPMQSFSQRTQQEAHNNRLTWVSWAIGAALVGMLVWWWLQKASLEPATSDQLVSESIIASIEPDHATQDLPIQQEVTEQAEAVLPQEIPLDINADTNNATDANESAEQEQTVAGNDSETGAEQASDVATQEQQSEPTTAPVVDNSVLNIDLTFSNDCWIKVTDADDKTLAIGVREKGSSLTLTGKAPVKFTIGAPKAVAITYNGQTYDMSQYKAGKIARFELPVKE